MKMELPIVKISVRNLVEFILREGDIDNRVSGGMNVEAMRLGSKIHRKIQKSMGPEYHAEIPMKYQIEMENLILCIEGRADGVLEIGEDVIIDEIKGTFANLESLKEPIGVHLAQAKCYAFMYGQQNQRSKMGVQLTYCQMETEEIQRFFFEYTMSELEKWFYWLVEQYKKWAAFQIEWKTIRNTSIKQIQFPFAYRPGQRELASGVYRTILRKKKLFIQAPTGVGKTMSSVFPAVKAVGEELGEKIFYLTAKTITRTVAEQAFSKLREQDLRYKVITLTAKEKLCFCEEPECNPEACPYAKGHFDRVNDAVYDLLTATDEMTRETIEKQAKEYQVCPFEMMLDLALWVDAVICDYNYVFDPNVHLKRFFSEGNAGGYLFLIDESHNLVERGRNMYSASLYKEDFLLLKRMVKNENLKLYKSLGECNQAFLELKKECETYQILESISSIYLKLFHLIGDIEAYLEECNQSELREKVLELYFAVRHFLNIYETMDEHYVMYSEFLEDGRFVLRLFCVNPATQLENYLSMGNSTIFFSATLLPIQYYKKLLSVKTDDYAIYANSSFDTKKRLLLAANDVSTKYTKRSGKMYQKYAEYILRAVQVKNGNYMAFFPSYQFMNAVYEEFLLLEDGKYGIDSVIQSNFMNEQAREIFLEHFEENREDSLVGFCVLGGIFSEGIDLTEEQLIGAFIVGTGLPQVCSEREILRQFFEADGVSGFDYAYLFPGMNKVLQAAGRVIRTEEDKGIILLLDERFQEKRCQNTFPKEWSDCKPCNLTDVEEKICVFWKRMREL